MLPFGSLLSQIPLIILALAYLLYFGASALNKVQSEDEQALSAGRVQEVERTITVKESDSDNGIYYYKAFRSKFSICRIASKIILFQDLPEIVPHYCNDRLVISFFNGFNLFSRPPPSYQV
jgi:hypothetical protein